MPKKVNQSGEQNFLIGLSKQTAGSDGFMPSGHHNHKKFWYIVLGIIVVIVLFIFGENIYSSHQSNSSQPAHHPKVTKVTNKKPARHHAKKTKPSKQSKAKAIRERAQRRAKRAKRLIRQRVAAERKAARRDRSTTTSRVAPQRQTTQTYRTMRRGNGSANKAGSNTNSSANTQRQR